MDIQLARKITGGLSKTGKMPGPSFSISAFKCKVGGKLSKIKGSVCEQCYAKRGNYLFAPVKNAHKNRLKGMANPMWIQAMTAQINASGTGWFRFFDSGDLQSLQNLEMIVELCETLPHVKFWLPTKEYGFVQEFIKKHGKFPRNLMVRLSAYIIDGPLPTALAKRLGVTVSGVTRDHSQATCQAPENGGTCGDCRACWLTKKPVMYYKH